MLIKEVTYSAFLQSADCFPDDCFVSLFVDLLLSLFVRGDVGQDVHQFSLTRCSYCCCGNAVNGDPNNKERHIQSLNQVFFCLCSMKAFMVSFYL